MIAAIVAAGEAPTVVPGHVDHYAGVKRIVSDQGLAAKKVKIIASQGFLEEAVSENVIAGNAMTAGEAVFGRRGQEVGQEARGCRFENGRGWRR